MFTDFGNSVAEITHWRNGSFLLLPTAGSHQYGAMWHLLPFVSDAAAGPHSQEFSVLLPPRSQGWCFRPWLSWDGAGPCRERCRGYGLYLSGICLDVPEAIYGAVLLNQATNEIKYFTLEASYEDKWAVCSRDTSMHSCHGFWDSADKAKFVEWVMDRLQR